MLPLVGNVLSWYWATPEPETKGRSFDLLSTSIKPTEFPSKERSTSSANLAQDTTDSTNNLL
jgi:hypothetical protein